MTVIAKKPHEHEWGVNLYNSNGRYWFRVCKGFIQVKRGKIVMDEPCGDVDRWTTMIHRKPEIPGILDVSEEWIIQRRSERDASYEGR